MPSSNRWGIAEDNSKKAILPHPGRLQVPMCAFAASAFDVAPPLTANLQHPLKQCKPIIEPQSGMEDVLGSAALYDIPNANSEALLKWQFPEHTAHICDTVGAWGLSFGSISAEDMFNSLSGACNRIGRVLIALRGARDQGRLGRRRDSDTHGLEGAVQHHHSFKCKTKY